MPSSTATFFKSATSLFKACVEFSASSTTIVKWSRIITEQSRALHKYLILSINRSISSKSKPSYISIRRPAPDSSNHFFKSLTSCACHTSGLRKFKPASKDINDTAVSSATSSRKNAPTLISVVLR